MRKKWETFKPVKDEPSDEEDDVYCCDCGRRLAYTVQGRRIYTKKWFTCAYCGKPVCDDCRKNHIPLCVPADTLVLTNPDFKPISEVALDDEVAGYEEHQMVSQTFRRKYEGDLTLLRIRGLGSFRFTPEHPILVRKVIRRRKQLNRRKKTTLIEYGELRWKEASQLRSVADNYVDKLDWARPFDCVVVPKNNSGEEVILDFRKFTNWMTSRVPTQFHKPICLTENLAELMGWYVAEGHVSHECLVFSLGLDEGENIDRVKTLIESIGYKPRVRRIKGERGVTIHLSSHIFGRAFSCWFGRGAHNKKLPDFMFKAEKDVINAFLQGYFNGDGSVIVENSATRIRVSSASQNLLRQIQLLALKIGLILNFGLYYNPPSEIDNRTIKGGTQFILRGTLETKARQKHRLFFEDAIFHYFPILSVEKEPFSGYVHNLETQEGIFRLPFIVHNCLALTWGQAKIDEETGELVIVDEKPAQFSME